MDRVPPFGQNLERLRKRAGLSQKQLASLLGHVDNSTVSGWEKRVTAPASNSVARLAKLIDATIEELMQGVPNAYEDSTGLAESRRGRRIVRTETERLVSELGTVLEKADAWRNQPMNHAGRDVARRLLGALVGLSEPRRRALLQRALELLTEEISEGAQRPFGGRKRPTG